MINNEDGITSLNFEQNVNSFSILFDRVVDEAALKKDSRTLLLDANGESYMVQFKSSQQARQAYLMIDPLSY